MKILKIIFISDFHLIKDNSFLGIDTFKSLEGVIMHILKNQKNYKYIFLLGDFVQDQKDESFKFLNDQLSNLNAKKIFIRGNHDTRNKLPIKDFKEKNNKIVVNNWAILQLTSYKQNKIYGEVTKTDLKEVKNFFQNNRNLNGLLYMHHNLFKTDSPWLDIHITKNFQYIRNELSKIENLKLVISGHVHQFTKNIINGTTFITIPSTSAQFKNSTEKFTLDSINPGYMRFDLKKDGNFNFKTFRISGFYGNIEKNPKPY